MLDSHESYFMGGLPYMLIEIIAIVAIIISVILYCLNNRNKKKIRADDYASALLKKVKELHLQIDKLRGPKLFNEDTLENDIKTTLIPEIDNLYEQAKAIDTELLVGEHDLKNGKDIRSQFHNMIMNDIMKEIKSSEINFCQRTETQQISVADIKHLTLFKLFYPYEKPPVPKLKSSILNTKNRVVDDDFNQKIEENFSKIYQLLERHLIRK